MNHVLDAVHGVREANFRFFQVLEEQACDWIVANSAAGRQERESGRSGDPSSVSGALTRVAAGVTLLPVKAAISVYSAHQALKDEARQRALERRLRSDDGSCSAVETLDGVLQEFRKRYGTEEPDASHYASTDNPLTRPLFPSEAGTIKITASVYSSVASAHVHPLSDIDNDKGHYQDALMSMMRSLDKDMEALNSQPGSTGPSDLAASVGTMVKSLTDRMAREYPQMGFRAALPDGTTFSKGPSEFVDYKGTVRKY
ncbi:uncharacterized protein I303_105686 [Kwoniella dejecticola CBS 10117]|uniref:Uncharacterized protein n=1 Tax=Kwoniella dejecticola CBS 10117 TaxID=1296121 RepID=A0A1A6A051_9TREE|nr:uncharacterized protein I303_05708 [Kwoniella dejecticola CBS 10117]OBR83430.1 hypothetical protein I303_05708 [Kwoniella dejecticola CBS 10117]